MSSDQMVEQSRKFGLWVRACRKAAGFETVNEAAEKAGVSRDTWTSIELGGRTFYKTWRPLLPCEPEKLQLIARVLSIPEEEVFRRAGAGIPTPIELWTDTRDVLAAAVADLTEEVRLLREEVAALRARKR